MTSPLDWGSKTQGKAYGQEGEKGQKSQNGEEGAACIPAFDRLDAPASAQSFEEEKMSKDKKPPPPPQKPREAPKPERRPAHDHIIRQDSDGRKIEKTTDWNKPPRKDKDE